MRVLLSVPVAVRVAEELWLLLKLKGEVPLGLVEGLVPLLRLLVEEEDRDELRLQLLLGVGNALLLLL